MELSSHWTAGQIHYEARSRIFRALNQEYQQEEIFLLKTTMITLKSRCRVRQPLADLIFYKAGFQVGQDGQKLLFREKKLHSSICKRLLTER